MKKIILLTALFLGSLFVVKADDNWYAIGETISIKSTILDEERTIIVYTPATYNLSENSYPVMYLLDGGTHFHHATGIAQFLSANGIIPEMIVVAVVNVDRTRDFSPTHVDKWKTTGGAKKFMGYINEELMPFMNKNYRTVPYELLVGHSFGGEFATYALLNYPDIFNAYIAISPYMMYDDGFILKEAKTKLKEKYKNEVQFYMTIGNEPDYFATLNDFESIVEQKSPKNFEFTYVKFENDNHGSVPHMSIYKGLESIFSDWKLSKEEFSAGLASIDNHYQMISEKYGYVVSTPELTINALGYYYINEKDLKHAIKVFKENINRYPNSANVYDSLGEAYENDGQLNHAQENYQKAVEIATKDGHVNLTIYEKNLKRVQKELAQK